MGIIGFNHFQLDSGDVEKTRKFYESIGGECTQTMERSGGWRGYHVKLAEGTTIEIQPPRDPENVGGTEGWDHLALNVTDCSKVCDLIEQAGGCIAEKPSEIRYEDQSYLMAVAYGIDGEKIELVQKAGQPSASGGKLILGTNHMQVNAADIEESCLYYQKAFGGQVVGKITDPADPGKTTGYWFEIVPGSVLKIQSPEKSVAGKSTLWNTIAIETTDIEASLEQILNAGGIKMGGPMKGSMGTINILNSVVVGPSQEHVELIQII